MRGPFVLTRMEERPFFLRQRVNRVAARSLAERTRHASEREVAFGGLAAFVDGKNVVNVKGSFLSRLRQTTVFATVLRSRNDQTTQARWNCCHATGLRARGSLHAQAQQGKHLGEVNEPFGFAPLGLGQRLPLVLPNKAWRRSSTPGGKRNRCKSSGICNSISTACAVAMHIHHLGVYVPSRPSSNALSRAQARTAHCSPLTNHCPFPVWLPTSNRERVGSDGSWS